MNFSIFQYKNENYKPLSRYGTKFKKKTFYRFNTPLKIQKLKKERSRFDQEPLNSDLKFFQSNNSRNTSLQKIEIDTQGLASYFNLNQITPITNTRKKYRKSKKNHPKRAKNKNKNKNPQTKFKIPWKNKENCSQNQICNEKIVFQREMFPKLKLKQKKSLVQKIKKTNNWNEKKILNSFLDNKQNCIKDNTFHSPNSQKIRRVSPKKPKPKPNDEDIICSLSTLLRQTMELANRREKIDQQKGKNFTGSWRVYHSSPIITNRTAISDQENHLNFEQNLYHILENINQDFSNFMYLRNLNFKNKQMNRICNDGQVSTKLKQTLIENNEVQQISLSINCHNFNDQQDIKAQNWQEISPALEFIIKDNQNEQIASLIFCAMPPKKENEPEREREREIKMDLENIKEKDNKSEKGSGFDWIETTKKSLVFKLPIVLIKVESKSILTQIGILDFLAFKYNCLMSRVRFSSFEMGKIIMNWSKNLNTLPNRKRKRKPKPMQYYQQQQQLMKKQQLKGKLSLNDEKEMEIIKFVYHSPAYKTNDIVLRLSHLSVSKIIHSRVISKDGKNLIQCIHEYFCTLHGINLDNCILNQILFPKFLLNRNGIIRFKKGGSHLNFLTLFNQIIC
ncbi:hypothetical protein M0813_06102 [Anaeramoeba flamelloides]|uniref:Uncharacterized protein n=1 Tax=Anaeramoeba flamelloides TaxID=1746091 RepID=A0ABQ8XET0_9EUKA|nr:hypothetical protein M0813_06102 [Anaeramoeba flamelloides]